MTRIDRTRVELKSFGFLAGCAMLLFFAASPSAAQPDPAADTIEIDLSVRALDYDEQTGLFIVTADSDDFSQCGSLRIHILDRSGNERWRVPTPVPCQTTIHDGILYASSENLIRSFDLATGTMIRSWTAPDQAKTRQLFFGGGLLWFNHGSTYSEELRHSLPSGVGTLDPQSDAPPTLRVIEDAQMVAASSDGGTQWVVTDRGLTKIDRNNPAATQPTVSIPGVYRGMWAPFVLANDEDHLYFAQGPTLIDAASLAVLDSAEPSRSFNSLDERPDGTLVADSGGYSTGAVAFAEDTVRPIGSLRFSDGSSVQAATAVGEQVAVVHKGYVGTTPHQWIQFYDLAPAVAGPIETTTGLQSIDANQPRTITMRVHFADAVESVTVNGQSLSFTALPEFGDKEWLSVQLPALPEGTHRIIFDGPLGRSAPTAANQITVGPPKPRGHLEVLVRPDSEPGEVEMWTICSDGDFGAVDISEKIRMRAGSRLVFTPVIGHTCSVQFTRLEYGGYDNDWRHHTTGFFDVDRDPNATQVMDVAEWVRRLTVTSEKTGVATYLPPFDETIVWTYSYGYGQAGTERTPVVVRCGQQVQTRATVFGYWQRYVVDRTTPCSIEHQRPPGARFSGFDVIHVSNETRTGFQEVSTIQVAAGQAGGYLVGIYDVYPHPSEDNGAFVRQQYLDFLGRSGDPGGLAHWQNALDRGTRARTDLVRLFLDSPEFGGTVAPVNRLYQAYFDRAPDRGGLYFWVNWIRSGRTLGQVSDEFARSAEFERTYGSLNDEDFIDLVYQNVLDRKPDAAGRAFWVDRMASGLTRGELMVNFSESIEFVEKTRAAVLVDSLYQGLLQRSPDRQGFVFWTGQVEAGRSLEHLISGMLASDEYFNRFDDLVDQGPRAGAASLIDESDAALQRSPILISESEAQQGGAPRFGSIERN